MEQFVTTNVNGVNFEFHASKRKSNGHDNFFVLDTATFPYHLLNQSSGKSPHRKHCNTPESKWIKKPIMVLKHPFFYDCYQAYLP